MHCQTNRHRVDQLADLRRQKRQIEERIEELREEQLERIDQKGG
jgi:hypothetical protein